MMSTKRSSTRLAIVRSLLYLKDDYEASDLDDARLL